MSITARSYVRLSFAAPDADPERDPNSLQRQQFEIERYAASHDLQMTGDPYVDNDRSGWKPGVVREQFDRAIADLVAGVFDVLLLTRIDRLTRQGIEQLGPLMGQLAAAGRRFVVLDPGLDSSRESDRLTLILLSEQARAESANTSARVKSQRASLRRTGRRLPGRLSFGLSETDHRVRPHDTGGPIARGAIERLIAGETLAAVASWLSDQTGRRWSSSSVRYWAMSPTLRGIMGTRPETGPYTIPYLNESGETVSIGEPLLSESEYAQIEAAVATRRLDLTGKGKRKGLAMLSGLIRCGGCGSTMSLGGRADAKRYGCDRMRVRNGCPAPATIVAPKVERWVISFLAVGLWKGPESLSDSLKELLFRSIDPAAGERERVASAELADAERRLARLSDQRWLTDEFEGENGIALYAKQRGRLVTARDAASARRDESRVALMSGRPAPTIREMYDEIQTRVDAGDAPAVNRLIKVFVQSVVVQRAGGRGSRMPVNDRVQVNFVPEFVIEHPDGRDLD